MLGLGPGGVRRLPRGLRRRRRCGRRSTATSTRRTAPLLETTAELGLLGAGALYAVWLVPAIDLRRRWRQERSQLKGSVLVALVGLLAASMWETRTFALPLWFLAALTLALGRPRPARLPLFAPRPTAPSGQVVASHEFHGHRGDRSATLARRRCAPCAPSGGVS